jgi:F-type H+-transporting ATPase subunit gamma
MSLTFEHAQTRLKNIKAIEPLLGALRTLSMGAWHLAQNKVAKIKDYENKYNHILIEILPHINARKIKESKQTPTAPSIADSIILLVGSERGLCGKFNETLAETAIDWINSKNFKSYKIWALGSRMIKTLDRMNVNISWRKPFPSGNLVSYQQCFLLTQNWLDQYENHEFNHFIVLSNLREKNHNYSFSSFSLLPYSIDHSLSAAEEEKQRFPPPIIETDPQGIYHQIIQQYIALSFYQIVLKSTAAEHAARFQLMEEAQENAEDMINKMNQIINTERKKRITQQMQELATGAGLLDNK